MRNGSVIALGLLLAANAGAQLGDVEVLLVTDRANARVLRVDLETLDVTTLSPRPGATNLLVAPNGIDFSEADNAAIVADPGAGKLVEIDFSSGAQSELLVGPAGGPQLPLDLGSPPVAVALQPGPGRLDLYVAVDGAIHRLRRDATGTTAELLVSDSALAAPEDIALEGSTAVGVSADGHVVRYELGSQMLSTLQGVDAARGLVISSVLGLTPKYLIAVQPTCGEGGVLETEVGGGSPTLDTRASCPSAVGLIPSALPFPLGDPEPLAIDGAPGSQTILNLSGPSAVPIADLPDGDAATEAGDLVYAVPESDAALAAATAVGTLALASRRRGPRRRRAAVRGRSA